MNFPDGMSRSDWDHVYGISRCLGCGAELPEEIVCKTCGTAGCTPPDEFGNRDPCPDCETPRERFNEGYCPDGCADEQRADEEYDRLIDEQLEGRDPWE